MTILRLFKTDPSASPAAENWAPALLGILSKFLPQSFEKVICLVIKKEKKMNKPRFREAKRLPAMGGPVEIGTQLCPMPDTDL